jgi:hypothetical protein
MFINNETHIHSYKAALFPDELFDNAFLRFFREPRFAICDFSYNHHVTIRT